MSGSHNRAGQSAALAACTPLHDVAPGAMVMRSARLGGDALARIAARIAPIPGSATDKPIAGPGGTVPIHMRRLS